MKRLLLIAGTVALLAGCATMPEPLKGRYSSLTPEQARERPGADARGGVRWGGEIVMVRPKQTETCIEILARPLNESARPIDEPVNLGRFIACKSGFLDPAVFEEGRAVTVTGSLAGVRTRPIGDYEYTYPVVAADVVYLWPDKEAREYGYYGYGYPVVMDPFFWPYPTYVPFTYYTTIRVSPDESN